VVEDVPANLSFRVLDFFETLRREHGFGTSQREVHDALHAFDLLGISNGARVRAIMRSIACSSPEQIGIFETAYDEVFLAQQGTEQPGLPSRHTRPGAAPEGASEPAAAEPRGDKPSDPEDPDGAQGPARKRRIAEEPNEALEAWMTLRARYSAQGARGEPPTIELGGYEAMEAAARKLVRSIHLGRSRRLTPQPHGPRFDVRRTLRTSLQTGGDPVMLRRLGSPRRAPRVVLLIDGSRSMAEAATVLLQFGYALARATRRARIYSFSTELHDLTRTLQRARPGDAVPTMGESWGGGTRIGASLSAFVRRYAPRVLDDQTLVVVASDGLDAGEGPLLERAMREIRRRSAGVVWLNPHAASRGFAPIATGMRSAAPFIDVLASVEDSHDVELLAGRLARSGRRG
jgi:uncharacterized protein with von Willebrand factor type A (vWA) domain